MEFKDKNEKKMKQNITVINFISLNNQRIYEISLDFSQNLK